MEAPKVAGAPGAYPAAAAVVAEECPGSAGRSVCCSQTQTP